MSLVIGRGAAGLLSALGIAVLTTSALAQSATPAGTAAINAKRNQTRLPAGYYARPAAEPQRGAADGAYQYFTGSQGDGAIYWSPNTGAHLIYGNILFYFERQGRETAIGYPTNDPLPGPCDGCDAPDTVRRQSFALPSRVSRNQIAVAGTVLCEGPRGTVSRGVGKLSTTTRPQIEGASRTVRIGDASNPTTDRNVEATDDDDDDYYDDEEQYEDEDR